ncbi:hypothetical protein ZHAS_00004250 [Anopheles sinensis]|uniref:Uncharacterized protein n=1 Tax=Anopheles sinensis TaxID=74873 RepID=A0A084VGG0_ANOSI|nr:hypothetical protein ZHAS_00004250 [Anopheles sinensis]
MFLIQPTTDEHGRNRPPGHPFLCWKRDITPAGRRLGAEVRGKDDDDDDDEDDAGGGLMAKNKHRPSN